MRRLRWALGAILAALAGLWLWRAWAGAAEAIRGAERMQRALYRTPAARNVEPAHDDPFTELLAEWLWRAGVRVAPPDVLLTPDHPRVHPSPSHRDPERT